MQTNYRRYKNYSYVTGSRLPLPRKKKRLRLKPLVLAASLVGVTFVGHELLFAKDSSGQSTIKKAAVIQKAAAQAPPKVEKSAADLTTLQPALESISKKYPYNTSVAVVDLNSGNAVQSGDSAPYVAASTTKILTAMMYLHEVEEGKASLNTSIGGRKASEQLRLMINRSDNTAWDQLNKYLGYRNLEAYAKQHGLTSFNAKQNTVTSSDMARLLAKFYKQEIINAENTKLLLSWMQNTSEERFIPASVPANITTHHKAGFLTDRVHDVAIIDNGKTPLALVVYSKAYSGGYSYAEGSKLFKQITEQVLTTIK